MKNLNILNILRSFSKTEIRLFDKFLRSPYFNNQATLARMFQAVRKYYPKFDSEELDRKKIFRQVTPGKRYNGVLFRKYVSNLTKLAEEFLIQRYNDTDKEGKSRALLDEYYRRRVNKMFEKTLRNTEKEQLTRPGAIENYFLSKYMLQEIKIDFELMNERQPIEKELFLDSQYYLFNHFIMLTINNLVELINFAPRYSIMDRKDIVSSFVRNFNYEKFLDEISELSEEKFYAVKMNFLDLYMVLKPDNSKYYFEMKEMLRKQENSLSTNAFYMYLIKIINYCIHRVNKGDRSFKEEIFENYDFALHSEKYLAKLKQNLSFAEFRNALLFPLELHKLEWAKWFVENFIGFVREEQRQNILEYANAFLAFEQKEFLKSLKHHSKIEYIHPVTRFDADLLLTKLYYELNYFDACYSLIDSFRHLIVQNTFLSDNVKIQYLNYLKFYKKLLDIKQGKNSRETGLLKGIILNEKLVKCSGWLIEKAEELES